MHAIHCSRRYLQPAVFILIITCLFGATTLFAANISGKQDMAYCGSTGSFQLPDGSTIKTRLALNNADKEKGLSGIAADEFADDEAMLMVFFNYGQRSVVMDDTHFNLDVFFLDHTLTVVGLQRNLKAHPDTTEPPEIEQSKEVKARHILEMRSGTPQANQIEQGAKLIWTSSPSVHAVERCMAAIWMQFKT
jgi:uncharacterized membrane protein (UPF0127 family)